MCEEGMCEEGMCEEGMSRASPTASEMPMSRLLGISGTTPMSQLVEGRYAMSFVTPAARSECSRSLSARSVLPDALAAARGPRLSL